MTGWRPATSVFARLRTVDGTMLSRNAMALELHVHDRLVSLDNPDAHRCRRLEGEIGFLDRDHHVTQRNVLVAGSELLGLVLAGCDLPVDVAHGVFERHEKADGRWRGDACGQRRHRTGQAGEPLQVAQHHRHDGGCVALRTASIRRKPATRRTDDCAFRSCDEPRSTETLRRFSRKTKRPSSSALALPMTQSRRPIRLAAPSPAGSTAATWPHSTKGSSTIGWM